MILGTAGHIDHGKTSLVRALTGVDTDRLPEEKRRGITIALGFAPLSLDGVGIIGVVDVPGHEAFVRTMLAGASGIDLALLVIAADEGVMPQTREHLAILTLLGVRAGVVALTKSDLVDDEMRELAAEDVREAIAGSALADAPIVPVSSVTGAGLDDLRAAIRAAAALVPARAADEPWRMPVDRVFSVAGAGTVATGTAWTGTIAREATVRILPLDRTARVRSLESHGAAAVEVGAGTRVADPGNPSVESPGPSLPALTVKTTSGWAASTESNSWSIRAFPSSSFPTPKLRLNTRGRRRSAATRMA